MKIVYYIRCRFSYIAESSLIYIREWVEWVNAGGGIKIQHRVFG